MEWPVAPTPFHENGEVDYDSMSNILECMMINKLMEFVSPNYSEQFLLSDDEREKLTKHCLRKTMVGLKQLLLFSFFYRCRSFRGD